MSQCGYCRADNCSWPMYCSCTCHDEERERWAVEEYCEFDALCEVAYAKGARDMRAAAAKFMKEAMSDDNIPAEILKLPLPAPPKGYMYDTKMEKEGYAEEWAKGEKK